MSTTKEEIKFKSLARALAYIAKYRTRLRTGYDENNIPHYFVTPYKQK
jgi:hypothetical protein